jgi:hypothetical protein
MPRKRNPAGADAHATPEVKSSYEVITVTISAVVPGTSEAGKGFLALEGLEDNGRSTIFRVYTTEAARKILIWFLRKFEYPAELIEPVLQLKKSKLVGLKGKLLIEEREDRNWPDAIGFSRLAETELEDKLARLTVPSVDVNADLKKELEYLDEL